MKRIYLYIITIVAFFAAGVIIANLIIMPAIVQMGKEIVVPNVCNLPLETAIQELKKESLEGVVIERRYDQIIEEGKVIIQNPLPDAGVKAGRIINLTVSLGPQTVTVPYLEGIEVEKGKLIVRRLGLTIGTIDSLFSDSIVQNRIVSTVPEPGVVLKRGDAISLVVSKGIKMKMPDVVGKDISEVQTILNRMGLVAREVIEIEGTGTKGSVVVQSPKPGQEVSPSATIHLMVVK